MNKKATGRLNQHQTKFYLSEETYERFKAALAIEDKTIQEVLEKAVNEYVVSVESRDTTRTELIREVDLLHAQAMNFSLSIRIVKPLEECTLQELELMKKAFGAAIKTEDGELATIISGGLIVWPK